MKDERSAGFHPSPTLVAWAFTYPNDPVAMKVIASLPADVVPKLREAIERELSDHARAASELTALLEEACRIR